MAKLKDRDKVLRDKIKSRINFLIEEKGLKKVDLASLSEKDRQVINRWTNLNDNRGITIYTLSDFCDTMKIDLEDFFNDPIFKNN
ncbi:helix-turn-helix domain-containing protein [Myroides marinus]|uniref:helix-turn-helix domain-containing protein n=1 Tax=Myroides marinus TaxID=703342 RepID=UPI0025768637|nr:helix-turn-helix transcriptional regulator [Myroides marinus]MDM1376711.1 helix-turn-helix transcriptional regulator [Myroides marinus]